MLRNKLFVIRFQLFFKSIRIMLKEPKKTNVVMHISSCIIEKYNGYQAISIEFARKETKEFKPIDKIFKPTKNPEKKSALLFY